jgi:HK97 family phage prohead protease
MDTNHIRAYSLLEVKSVDDEQRTAHGIATTPTVDRMGDVVVPEGVVYRAPIKLHLYHKHDMPVGHVQFGKPTKSGIPFSATIPDVREEGTVRERVNEALHSLKYKLLDAVSIGFRVLDDGYEVMKSGGLRYTKWEMLELSLVGVPANPDAVITAFKSANSDAIRAALGIRRPLINGGIPLIQIPKSVNAPLAGGAVRLVKPTP